MEVLLLHECGGLSENGPIGSQGVSGTTRRHGNVGVDVALVEEVCH